MFEDQVADLPNESTPIVWSHASPRTLIKGAPRRAHRPIDILCAALSHIGQRIARGGIRRDESLAGRRITPFAIDEQLPIGGNEIVDPLVEHDGHDAPSSASPPRARPVHTSMAGATQASVLLPIVLV